MRKSLVALSACALLAACGRSGGEETSNTSTANAAAAEKPRPSYCFFQSDQTRGWAAKTDKQGNVVVTGEAYRSDPRYKAELMPATVSGATAEVVPTITQNDTGFAAPENWWKLSQTIPKSQAVSTVMVKCGADTIASLTVPRKK